MYKDRNIGSFLVLGADFSGQAGGCQGENRLKDEGKTKAMNYEGSMLFISASMLTFSPTAAMFLQEQEVVAYL